MNDTEKTINVETLFSIKGKSALITGGSRGIGLMIARGYIEAGATVYISSRNREVCDQVANTLSEVGTCYSIPADVASPEGRNTLVEELKKRELLVERLDGDIVRKSLTRDLGFSKEDRDKNIERVTFVAKLLSRNGVATLVSFVSPHIKARDNARKECTNFIEVFVDCPVSICEERDVKGMYKKARQGIIKDFTGVDDPYEAPPGPELVLKTDDETLEESTMKVISKLEELKFIEPAEEEEYTQDDEDKIKQRLESLGYL